MKKEIEYVEYKEEVLTNNECIKYALIFCGVILIWSIYYFSFDPFYFRDEITVPILKFGLIAFVLYKIIKKLKEKK